MYAGTLSYFAGLQARHQLANAQGQQIYKIDQTNIDTVLPKLNLSNPVKQDIQSSVNAGKYVITHTDNVSVPGWSGAGYAIIDPLTGSDAYMISGGENGGFLIWAGSTLMIIAAIGFVFSAPVSALIIGAMAVIGALLFSAGVMLLMGNKTACSRLVSSAANVFETLMIALSGLKIFKAMLAQIFINDIGLNFLNSAYADQVCGVE